MITSKEMRDISARLGSVHAPQYALREDGKRLHLELSELRDAYEEVTTSLRERAERAEARMAEDDALNALERATDALDRVRALCDEVDARMMRTAKPSEIRAAIEGDSREP